MQYKPIKNYNVENAVLGKDFNLGTTVSFFHAFTLMTTFKIVVFLGNNMVKRFIFSKCKLMGMVVEWI
jgi:hypothetical protein